MLLSKHQWLTHLAWISSLRGISNIKKLRAILWFNLDMILLLASISSMVTVNSKMRRRSMDKSKKLKSKIRNRKSRRDN